MKNNYPFELKPLPYAYDALEPYIDERTMRIHHGKHLQTYVNNLNNALKDYPELHDWNLEQLLYYSKDIPEEIRTAVLNNGGGVYNHNFYFSVLKPVGTECDCSEMLKAIEAHFGSIDDFKKEFKKQALSVFGSGYTWLALNENNGLQIVNTKNQDTLLPLNLKPLLVIDVWEHAYYLKHQNLRADYIEDWFKVVCL